MILDEQIKTGELNQVQQDMNMIIEEVQNLLICAAMYTHEDKIELIKRLKKLQGKRA